MAKNGGKASKKGHGVYLAQVHLKIVGECLELVREYEEKLKLKCFCDEKVCKVFISNSDEDILAVRVSDMTHIYRAGPTVVVLRLPQGSAIITTKSQADASKLLSFFELSVPAEKRRSQQSVFNMRTEESSAKQYFQFYGYLSQQQNMLQDYVRTGTYQSAMLQNTTDFKDKVVLDVGAGTGALSFFALQAGARKVYAIEASNMAIHCKKLVKENNFSDRMTVITGKVEEVEVPEKVDMIISEPMGYMLFNERMLETYLHAKKWLKPGGNMFPTKGILYAAPFTDEGLYLEQFSKANFWTQSCFHGFDVSCLRQEALEEYFRQPVLDTFDVRIVMAKPVGHMTDFLKTEEEELKKISIPLQYKMWSTGMVHGLAFWFDCVFCGSESSVWLSTAPFQPLTHWYQIRLLLPKPIFLHKDQEMTGLLKLVANERQSYDVTVELDVPGSGVKSTSTYDLKNPNFRYMTTPLSVPGTLHTPPTDAYFQDTPTSVAAPTPLMQQTQPAASMSSGNQIIGQTVTSGIQPVTHVSQPLSPNQQQLRQPQMVGSEGTGLFTVQAGNPTAMNLQAVSSSQISAPQVQQVTNPYVTPTSLLNPAAPQFVPLPQSSIGGYVGGYHVSNGLLSTPASGGYHQSTAMYVMGSQQMVYTQGRVTDVGAGGGGGGAGTGQKYQGGVAPSGRQLYSATRSSY